MIRFSAEASGNRKQLNRRELLSIGALGGAGAMFPSLSHGIDSMANRSSNHHLTGKSIILVFLQGGPSQFETFDPKPEAPDGVRTLTSTIQTNETGLFFGEAMGPLADVADKLTIFRNYQSNNAGHNLRPLVGPESRETQIGVHYSKVAGATRRETGMPTNMVLFPRAVDEEVPRPEARGDIGAEGDYSPIFRPFIPGGGGDFQSDLEVRIDEHRLFDDRRSLLESLDRIRHQMDSDQSLEQVDELQDQAYRLLRNGGINQAIDLSLERPEIIERYDTANFQAGDAWNHVSRGRSGYYNAQAKTIGKLLLIARRLVEAGCGFVTVHAGYAGVWDMHADGNNLNMIDGMNAVGYSFAHAMRALIDDLESTGMAEDVMVVATGEMGRTPRINKNGGRDHWAKLAPLVTYGGGQLPTGVVGRSTADGGEPNGTPNTPSHLIATMLQTLFDVSELRLQSAVPESVLDLAQAPGLRTV